MIKNVVVTCAQYLVAIAKASERQPGEQSQVMGDPRRQAEGDALVQGGGRRHHQDGGRPVCGGNALKACDL